MSNGATSPVEAAPHTVKFCIRRKGGYYAEVTLSDGSEHLFAVQETAPWQRTTEYFKWEAKSINRNGGSYIYGHDRTRAGAIRDVLIAKGFTA